MQLTQLKLRDFRNYARLDHSFAAGFHLFLGRNAQGKTNILEAIYLLATLRSFRGVGSAQLIRHQQKGYYVAGKLAAQTSHELKLYWSSRERRVSLDGKPVKRLSEFFGTLRAVVFCTEDLQLIKGPGRFRRRFLDFLLAQSEPRYLPLLQRYTKILRGRNTLLKQKGRDLISLESYTVQLVETGSELMEFRRALLPRLAPLAHQAYQRMVPGGEEFRLEYQPSSKDLALDLARTQARELHYGATLLGPHRDELGLWLNNLAASKYASEGQKRSIALALKMAQAEVLTQVHGSPPILLIDDVMGELDPLRRAAFLPLLQRVHAARSQVFMTATEAGWLDQLGYPAQVWEVSNGQLASAEATIRTRP